MEWPLTWTLLPPEVSIAGALGLGALSFCTSALSAAAGIGGGIVMLAVLVSFLPPLVVLPVHALVQIGSNAGRAWLLREFADRRIVAWFSAGTLLGVAAASRVFVALPVATLEMIIAAFVLYAAWAPRLRPSALAVPGYALVGAGTGFATVFVGGTGSLVAAFFSPERLGRERLVATHASCMSVQHTLKVVAFGLIGFQFAAWLPVIAFMIAAGFAGTLAGRRLLGWLPERHFALLFRAVLTVIALRLLLVAASEL